MTQNNLFILLSSVVLFSCSSNSIYPNLNCQCGFKTCSAKYYSENLSKDGSIALFNDLCKSENEKCSFKRCVLYSMNILKKKTNPTPENNATYALSTEHTIKAHILQAFTGSDFTKNYLVASILARDISRLHSWVPATTDCNDAKWTTFLETLDAFIVRNEQALQYKHVLDLNYDIDLLKLE